MLSYFDDDTYPRLRRSIVVVGGLISFIAHYRVGIDLDAAFFKIGVPNTEIRPTTFLWALWAVLAYMCVRYAMQTWALMLKARLDYGKISDLAERANRQFEKIESFWKQHNMLTEETLARISRLQEGPPLWRERLDIYERSLLKERKQLNPQAEQKLNREHQELVTQALTDFARTLQQVEEQASKTHSEFEKITGYSRSVEEKFRSPIFAETKVIVTDDKKSKRILGLDQFGMSSIVVLFVVAIAASKTYIFWSLI